MTEAEWLTCVHPQPMRGVLWCNTSDRKRRLFAVACCRRIWRILPDERSRRAVEIAERYADGQATEEELEAGSVAARAAWEAEVERLFPGRYGWELDTSIAAHAAYTVAIPLEWWGGAPAFVAPDEIVLEVVPGAGEALAQCRLLRDIRGNPFRPAINLATSIQFDRVIVSLAQAIYADRAFDRLPLLADALEDAGCTDAAILAHCRQPGEHVRGCWVVDLVLGKT